MCVRACVRACVCVCLCVCLCGVVCGVVCVMVWCGRACVRTCMRAYVRACLCVCLRVWCGFDYYFTENNFLQFCLYNYVNHITYILTVTVLLSVTYFSV